MKLQILWFIEEVDVSGAPKRRTYRKFCLQGALLTFCTTSSSARLSKITKTKLVIIDEAAQLKECESAIPLQLPNVQHAILVGDERQLPAMVQSKISEGAAFGRSPFERLVSLGHERHLLNVTEEQLAALFINCGQVVDCWICGDPNSVLRFAFVEFTDEEGARASLSLAGKMLGFYPVRVLPSKTAIAPVNPTFLPR